jgi:hypothetical protein
MGRRIDVIASICRASVWRLRRRCIRCVVHSRIQRLIARVFAADERRGYNVGLERRAPDFRACAASRP